MKPIEQESEGASSASEDDGHTEWSGIPEPPEVDHEAEYIDEDRYTTVTVEAMDLSRDRMREVKKEAEQDVDGSDGREPKGTKSPPIEKQVKRSWTKERPEKEVRTPKKKRKKFRYENKTERKLSRIKEKSKNSKQAKARRSG